MGRFWKNIKVKTRNFSFDFDNLLITLQIEENHCNKLNKENDFESFAKANIVESFHKPQCRGFKKKETTRNNIIKIIIRKRWCPVGFLRTNHKVEALLSPKRSIFLR